MNIEETVKMALYVRGFDKEIQLNNRGLIGAVIDETIIATMKSISTPMKHEASNKEIVVRFYFMDFDCDVFLNLPFRVNIGDQFYFDRILNEEQKKSLSKKAQESIGDSDIFLVKEVLFDKKNIVIHQTVFVEKPK